MDFPYTHPNYHVTREIHVPNVTGIASTSVRKFHMFLAAKLKAVHGIVLTAGTNASAGFDILVGTASVGEIVFGTNTAGVVAHSAVMNADIPKDGLIDIKGKADSATLVASLVVEYVNTPASDES